MSALNSVSPSKEVGLQPAFLRSGPVIQNHDDIRSRLIAIIEPVCTDSGYELVDLTYQREARGWILRVFIDKADAATESISFKDCENVSRELSAVLDVEDPVQTAYSLEVSSPGVERPLRTAEHFRKVAGKSAKIALDVGVDGRRNFKGVVDGFDDDAQSILVTVDGEAFSLPLSDLRSAKLVVDWDAVLKERAARPKEQTGA